MNPFERVQVGSTDVFVTRLGLGGAPVGGHQSADPLYAVADYREGVAIADRALELGIRYFDTAPSYGDGRSEVRYGAALGGRDRREFVVSTKAAKVLELADPNVPDPVGPDGLPGLVPRFDMNRDGIRQSHEESLRRLGMDYVDILFLHDTSEGELETAAHESAMPALLELREEGVVKAIGAGTKDSNVMTRIIERYPIDIVLVPEHYSLLSQFALDGLLPLCERNNVSVVVGTPFNSGILASDLDGPALFNYRRAPEEIMDRAKALKAICDRRGASLKAAAIQFVLAHPCVVSTIPGPSTIAQLEENAELSAADIPGDVWAEMKAEGLIAEHAPTP
jgi:D-threo-aldose 1-dehydrogenase